MTARRLLVSMFEVQIEQLPLCQRGQGGFFKAKPSFNSGTCNYEDTHKKKFG